MLGVEMGEDHSAYLVGRHSEGALSREGSASRRDEAAMTAAIDHGEVAAGVEHVSADGLMETLLDAERAFPQRRDVFSAGVGEEASDGFVDATHPAVEKRRDLGIPDFDSMEARRVSPLQR